MSQILEFEQFTLPNRMEVWVKPHTHGELISIRLLIRVGAAHQPLEDLGLAHFVEHLAFNFNNEKNSAKRLSDEITQHGGSLNAVTFTESTVFTAEVSHQHLEQCFELLRKCLTEPDFSKESVETEKGVVLNELDNDDWGFWESVYQRILGKYPFTHTGLGTGKTIKKITLKKVENFFRDHYVTNQMALICVGNVTTDVIRQKIEQYLGGLPSNDLAAPSYPYRDLNNKPIHITDEGMGHSILQGYRVCGSEGLSQDYYALWFLRDHLQTLLFEYVRNKGMLYTIDVIYTPFRHVGLFYVYVRYLKKGRRRLLKKIRQELQGLRTQKISSDAFRKTQEIIVSHWRQHLVSNRDLADYYVTLLETRKEGMAMTDSVTAIERLTPEFVQSTAERYFRKERVFFVRSSWLDWFWVFIGLATVAVWIFQLFKKFGHRIPGVVYEIAPLTTLFLLAAVIWLLIDRRQLQRMIYDQTSGTAPVPTEDGKEQKGDIS